MVVTTGIFYDKELKYLPRIKGLIKEDWVLTSSDPGIKVTFEKYEEQKPGIYNIVFKETPLSLYEGIEKASNDIANDIFL